MATEIKQLWTCPDCGRQFERRGQSHSCKPFALEQHFVHKDVGKELYEVFKLAVEKQVGPFKIESLECCIHFVSTSTFVAIKILHDKIRVDFSLARLLTGDRIHQSVQMSKHRYLHVIDIATANEIDPELMLWIQEAHDKTTVLRRGD